MKNKTLGENRIVTICSFLINQTNCLLKYVFSPHMTWFSIFFQEKHDSPTSTESVLADEPGRIFMTLAMISSSLCCLFGVGSSDVEITHLNWPGHFAQIFRSFNELYPTWTCDPEKVQRFGNLEMLPQNNPGPPNKGCPKHNYLWCFQPKKTS